ncbi:hypothetical protein BDZ94DRAFT_1231453 [Collybia nuda]|uniref:Uncharacterized protein n=1 Tax=Collybia nuda TaxID=64659 RepID=A0A9P5YJP8_9AGAR|nr:hypothetical protein BDZ94DRAFT_1231453 [Collybia nuda]
MIAGSVCGGVMGIAWIVGFTIYFTKRYKRKKLNRQVAAGTVLSKKKPTNIPAEKVIIPPDPAILLGHRLPGERVFNEDGNIGDQYRLESESQEPSVNIFNTGNLLSAENSSPPH